MKFVIILILAINTIFSGANNNSNTATIDEVHTHEAPHGGVLIELGDHFGLMELLHDPNKGSLQAWFLDGCAENYVRLVKQKIKLINPQIKIKAFKQRLEKKNIEKILKEYDLIVDGSDNFKTKFLLNKYCLSYKKTLIIGAISKMDGHIFTFNFENNNVPCLKCFYQTEPSDEILNCEHEGILGPVAGIVGNIQAIEVLKKILEISNKPNKEILILDFKKLNFRKVEFKKKANCVCKK